MVEVEIRGKKFPLCLTVAALDQINDECGGLKNLHNYLDGNGEASKAIYNTAWMLGLLIVEGEENRVVTSRFEGVKVEPRAVPDSVDLCHLMTISEAKRYRNAIFEAITESMHQEIEAAPSKNVENAEQG